MTCERLTESVSQPCRRDSSLAFQIPTEDLRSRLVPECDAKLIFRLRTPDGQEVVERMWVQITGYTETGYAGVLDNEPKSEAAPLRFGDRVEFQPEHVIEAMPPERWSKEHGWQQPPGS